MKNKNYLTLVFLALALLALKPVWAESEACEIPSQVNRLIDGPANVRERPDDGTSVTTQLKDKTPVTIVNCLVRIKNNKKLRWYYIEWKGADQKKEGWTAAQNIR